MKHDDAEKIRYIKLGARGSWWKTCKDQNIIKLGFNSGIPDVFEMANAKDWDKINLYWRNLGVGTPKHHTNAMKEFFEDNGKTLWITFEDGCLYYAFSDGGEIITKPPTDNEEGTSYRKLTDKGWSNKDDMGNTLSMETLSGKLTRTAAYRQTICTFSDDVEIYINRRLSGKLDPDLINAQMTKNKLEKDVSNLIKKLTWKDFELLVELIFANSGMQKTTRTGGSQKTTDLDLKNPITGERYFVQVKSKTNQMQFEEYSNRKANERSSFSKMYYVYHTGKIQINDQYDDDVILWNDAEIAKQVVNNGLIDWLFDHSN